MTLLGTRSGRPSTLAVVASSIAVVAAMVGCRTVSDGWYSTSDLSEALLTVSDVEAGWRERQRDIFDVREAENPVLEPSTFCPAASAEVSSLEILAGQSGADVEMQRKDATRLLRSQAWNNETTQEFFDAVTSIVALCAGEPWTDTSVGVTSSMDRISGPEIGDESIHWRSISSPPSDNSAGKFGGVGRTTVARFGKVIMMVQIADFALDPSAVEISENEWTDLVELAAAKMSELTAK